MEVFFLVFANDDVNPLPHLKDEAETVYDITWRKAADRNFIPFYAPFPTIDQINKKLNHCKGNISVFLYSGHANANTVLLSGDLGNTDGIGMHLKSSIEAKVLKLVVLNACATKDAVKALLNLGVPVVIATQAKVEDKHASEFAKGFFEGLVQEEKTIMESFQKGLAYAQTSSVGLKLGTRELKFESDLDTIDDSTPLWEIFALNEEFVNMKVLPKYNTDLFKFRYNEKLLKTIYTSFYNAGNPKVVKLWEEEQKTEQKNRQKNTVFREDEITRLDKEGAISNSIPMPIGVQLNNLLRVQVQTPDHHSKQFRNLVRVFLALNEFLAIIMISQLWEVKLRCQTFNIPPKIIDMWKIFFQPGKNKKELFDYAKLIIMIIDCLNDNSHDDETINFLKTQKICADLLKIDKKVFEDNSSRLLSLSSQNPLENEIERYCFDAEEALCNLFSILGFLHQFELKSVRHIETIKKRHESVSDARFHHQMFSLNQTLPDENVIKYIEKYYLDSYGQVIIKSPDRKTITDFLNLSPFIVDLSAFQRDTDNSKSVNSRIVIFNKYIDDYRAEYKDIMDNNQTVPLDIYSNEKYEPIKDELKAFKIMLNNSTIV